MNPSGSTRPLNENTTKYEKQTTQTHLKENPTNNENSTPKIYTNDETHTSNVNIPSYASKTKQTPTTQHPSKTQAIVMHALENTELLEYLRPVGKIIQAKNIIFCSRISGNRICMYLTNKILVDKIMATSPYIDIGNQRVQIRRLITPSIRLVISNVCPTIPHKNIMQALQEAGLKPVSPIIFLRSGIQEPEFAHLLSFRRQVFISQNEETEIPESLTIQYEDNNYRIFLSTESFICHICKEQGHIARKCPSQNNQPEGINQITKNTVQTPQTTSENKQIKVLSQKEVTTENTENTENNTTQKKRNIESEEEILTQSNENLSQASTDTITPTQLKSQTIKPKPKRINRSISLQEKIPIETMMEPIKQEMYLNPEKYSMSFEVFQDILENACGATDPINIIMDYTDDLNEVISTMEGLKPFIKHRPMKHRFTRLINAISTEDTREQTN